MKKYKYTGETRDAIEASLTHWEEIEAIIANADDKSKILSGLLVYRKLIGEKTCALCQMFPDDVCRGCPLAEEGLGCNWSNSPYRRVQMAWIDQAKDIEITLAVSGMVRALEGLFELEEPTK